MTGHTPHTSEEWTLEAILAELRDRGTEKNRAGMARFGIDTANAFGVPMAELRPFARKIGRSEDRAKELWDSGHHEARLLAILTIPPAALSDKLAWEWLSDIQAWDLCDQLTNVLAKRPGSEAFVRPLAKEQPEFLRRAGFALIAWRAVHAKKPPDEEFLGYFPVIKTASTDPRNFVWKAVHWALRQIGKRSQSLHGPAVAIAEELMAADDKTSRRIGRESHRELTSAKVLQRLGISETP